MSINKTSLPINFAMGLDTQSDPNQVAPGKFLSLSNSVFDKAGRLTKRSGFAALTPLSNLDSQFITKFGGNLTAIGSRLSAYSAGSQTWVDKGALQPADVNVLSVIRSNVGQSQADSVTHPNNITCTVYTNDVPTGGGVLTPSYNFVVTDSATGQRINTPTVISVATGTVTHPPKVFLLNNYFVIVFVCTISGVYHLQYVAINAYLPTLVSTSVNLSSSVVPGPLNLAASFEGCVDNNNLYLAWNSTAAVRVNYLDSTLALHTDTVLSGQVGNIISLCADDTVGQPIIYISAYNATTTAVTAYVMDKNLASIGAPAALLTSSLVNLTSAAKGGVLTAFYEQPNVYGYDTSLATNVIRSITMTQAGVVAKTPSLVCRGVGIASKAFILMGGIYILSAYVSAYQPTYFLMNAQGGVIVKLAYSNGPGSYYVKGLASATVVNNTVRFSYLIKDRIEAISKLQGSNNASSVYSQTGVNTASVQITSANVTSSEVGHNLHVSGGFMWMYDGAAPVEHGFHLWPDYVEASAGSGGAMAPQLHYYVATYEWTDAQGNVHRSAPSLPISADTSKIDPIGVAFLATFSTGSPVLTVSSSENLYVGQLVIDRSRKSAIPAGTKILTISGTTVTLDTSATVSSAAAPGDSMSTISIATTATFTSNSKLIQTTNVRGLLVGQTILDTTTPGNFSANTTITSIDPVSKLVGISVPTTGASATDQVKATGSTTSAYFDAGSTTVRVRSVQGFAVGTLITDSTVSGAFQANTHIIAVDPINYVITLDKPTVSSTGTPTLVLSPQYLNPLGVSSPGNPSGSRYTTYGGAFVTTPVIGQSLFISPSIPGCPRINVITNTGIDYIFPYVEGFDPLPNGNSGAGTTSSSLYQVATHTIGTSNGVFSSAFALGATSLNVSSTSGLGIGQTLTDLTTPGNLNSTTTITAIDAINNIVTISVATTGATTAELIQTIDVFSTTVTVPTYRQTYKIASPVRIALYRWSVAQQTYYQVTPVLSPIINDPSADFVTYTDTSADIAILGNNILYTTGGVIENIAAPPISTTALFKSRLFAVDAEDRNVLWYSKQVIENTPVEMSDLFTVFVAPTTAAQGDTGPITALGTIDDKLIIFKKNALYYLTGNGPDNTGGGNDFSEPVFITSSVGCDNPRSIVFTPNGLLFQSSKGIWQLGRDLSTTYIGAPVDGIAVIPRVLSAVNVPGTNEIRFMMDNGVTIMHDYYFQQWGTFNGIPAVSSTLYQNLHTYINAFGQVFQQTPGQYLDGGHPVLISFTTSWLNLAGLQGYERAYFFYLLGTFITPHTLAVSIAYDYNPSPVQQSIITPDNFTPAWGGEQLWGSGTGWGGAGNIEQHRVFLQQQKCQAFQLTINEIYDASFGVTAGAGFTLSGLNCIVGVKDSKPRLKAAKSVG